LPGVVQIEGVGVVVVAVVKSGSNAREGGGKRRWLNLLEFTASSEGG